MKTVLPRFSRLTALLAVLVVLTFDLFGQTTPTIPKYYYCPVPTATAADGAFLEFLYIAPNSTQTEIAAYLAAGPGTTAMARWRLATTTESAPFLKQFGSLPTAFEKESPQIAAQMKRLVVARARPNRGK